MVVLASVNIREIRLFAKAFLAVTPHCSIHRHFFSLCLPPFLVPLSVLFARKFCLLESLFLDKKSNQIDLLILNLIIFILCNGSSIGWVALAVVDAGGWTAGFTAAAAAYVAAVEVAVVAAPLFGGWILVEG